MIEDWSGTRGLTLGVWALFCFCAALFLFDTERFQWSGRIAATCIAGAYISYFIHEFFFSEKAFQPTSRSAASPWNALFGFLVIGLPSLMFAALGRLSWNKPAPPLDEWYEVAFNDEGVTRVVSPPGKPAWQDEFKWADVKRVCFKDEGLDASDGIYIWTSTREESYAIPIEAKGGQELWFEVIRREIFPNELAIKAAGSTDYGWYCWPPEDADSHH